MNQNQIERMGGQRERAECSCAAFTLTELVVVIAVLGLLVLTVLAYPPANRAYQTGCIANLRQVGNALIMYTEDNAGWLPPGPNANANWSALDQNQSAGYLNNSVDRRHLVYYLVSYLSLPAPTNTVTNLAKLFLCPGFKHYSKTFQGVASNSYCYSLTRNTNSPDLKIPYYPFGKRVTDDAHPHRLSEIASWKPLSQIWAVADLKPISK